MAGLSVFLQKIIGADVDGDKRRRRVAWLILTATFVLLSILGTIRQASSPEMPAPGFLALFDNNYRERFIEGKGKDKIVIIKADGIIVESQTANFTPGIINVGGLVAQLDKALNDQSVAAIILIINSPGGEVTASDTIYHKLLEVKEAGIKVVALMRNTAASGGYYIAAAADKIVANRSTITGSIGAIYQTVNIEGLEEKIGVRFITFKAGQYKDLLNPSRPITATEREFVQTILQTAHNQFKEVVAQSRGFNEQVLNELAQGQVYSGEVAKAKGLVDELGNLPEAIKLAKELAKLTEAQVVEYRPLFGSFSDLLLGSGLMSLGKIASDINVFTKLPQGVYYLWTP